jgi:hypothetical protein
LQFFISKIHFCKNTFKENRYYISLTNQFQGLARGPIDHEASSVINVVANGAISMGDAVDIIGAPTSELLPRVETSNAVQGDVTYGVAVGGDTDGIFGDGTAATDDSTRATAGAGQGVVVVTQGRCPARVNGSTGGTPGNLAVGVKLTQSGVAGVLEGAATGDEVIAVALQPVVSGELDIIAVDIQRGGIAA